jgi:hypothetical protein
VVWRQINVKATRKKIIPKPLNKQYYHNSKNHRNTPQNSIQQNHQRNQKQCLTTKTTNRQSQKHTAKPKTTKNQLKDLNNKTA